MLLDMGKLDLRTYLFLKRRTLKSLADAIDYTPSQISAVVNGKRKAGRKLAKLIEKATDGEIKAADILAMEVTTGEKSHV